MQEDLGNSFVQKDDLDNAYVQKDGFSGAPVYRRWFWEEAPTPLKILMSDSSQKNFKSELLIGKFI